MSKPEKKQLLSYEREEELRLAHTVAETLYRYDQVETERIPTLGDLADSDVKRFADKGYLVVDQVLNADEINQSIEALVEIITGVSTGSKIQYTKEPGQWKTFEEMELAVRKVHMFIDHEPRLRSIAYHSGILAVMERLIGEKPKVVQDQALLKPPTGGAEKPWHQDMAYGNLAYDRMVVGIWIALDPAEVDNGCMHVIPYSHRDGAVPHYAERDWQICDSSIQVSRDVAVPLKPGGALIFSGLLHHGTPPNFSAKRRRSLQIHYAPDSAGKLTPQEYKRYFTNQMTGAEC